MPALIGVDKAMYFVMICYEKRFSILKRGIQNRWLGVLTNENFRTFVIDYFVTNISWLDVDLLKA